MAVAVVMPSHMAAFKGDGEHLLDMLVEACAAKTQNSQHAGYGRELIPCADAWLTAGDTKTTRHEGRKTHKYGGNNAGRSPASPPRPSGRADTKAPTSNAKCAVFKRSASYGLSDAASPIAIPFTNQMTNNNASSPRPSLDAGVFSCPAVAASPKPEALPMPTSGLLTRVASRGRSPSPSKVAAAMYSAPQPAIQGMIYRQQVAAA
jgi:hypothetical protein